MKVLTLSELHDSQISKYKSSILEAFPAIIHHSPVIKNCWSKLESYYPQNQVFFFDDSNKMIGFINTVPLYWDRPMNELPNDGWDWMLQKGIEGYENKITPNTLGGLQIIVTKDFLRKGYSKQIIRQGKKLCEDQSFDNFIIPIRPTLKHKHPEMQMKNYLHFKQEDKLFDPWIRTHVNAGAKIIDVCSNSMNIKGDIPFWEKLIDQKIKSTGYYHVPGALNPVHISLDQNQGEYQEENIWIKYGH